jgi:prolyl-tRNA synthetase
VRSHGDLPFKFYQIVNTFRYETKHTRPLIRVREITTFKEAHTVHVSKEDADLQVEDAISIYKQFFDLLGIPYVITKRPVWDKFPGAEYTMAFDTLMPDGKTLQIGTVHNLGQTFAKTFDIKYETPSGEHEYVYQTCYGVSDRVIASVIGIHGDESGLRLPPQIAPYQIVIVPIIFKKGGAEVIAKCHELQNTLKDAGFRVHLDDRDLRPGKKFYEWEMRGVPLRIELGPRDLENNKAVVSRRDLNQKTDLELNDEFIININEFMVSTISNMKEMAWEKMNSQIRIAETVEEARSKVENNHGIISFSWCGEEKCGKKIEEEVKVDILGVQGDDESGECINCGSPGKYKALLAKTY